MSCKHKQRHFTQGKGKEIIKNKGRGRAGNLFRVYPAFNPVSIGLTSAPHDPAKDKQLHIMDGQKERR